MDFLHSRAKDAFQPLIQALYLSGKSCDKMRRDTNAVFFFSLTRFFILGNEHLVPLLDGNFLRSSLRQQLDAEYRFPTAVGRQLTGATSVEDEKLRQLSSNMESLETKIANWELTDSELTKFDDEVQMGFDVQLLTPDLLEQYPHLDPTKRSMKVGAELLDRSVSLIHSSVTEC